MATSATGSANGVRVLDQSLVALGSAQDKATAATDRTTRATKLSGTAAQQSATAQREHAAAVARVNSIMGQYAGESTRVQAAALRVAAAQERVNALQASGAATTRELATANAALLGAQRSLVAAQEAGAVAATGLRASLGGLVGTARDLGLLFGALEIGKKAIEFIGAGKDLTTALNSVQAASHATDEDMRAVRAQVIGLGKDLTVPGATAVDAAEAIDDLVRAGMTLPRAMGSARAALLLAAAANVDTADSARVLGDVLDEFKLPASEAAKTAGFLAGAATSASGGLMGVFQAFTYVGTRARALGLGVQDIAAAIVDLSKAGITADRAGTGLAMMFQRLASESPKGQKALDDLGVTAFNAQGKFVGLPIIIDQLHAAQQRFGTGSQRFLKDVSDAFGARAANAVTAFALRGREGYDAVYQRLSSGDVQKAADLMNRGVGAALRQLSKQFTAVGIDAYQNLEPQLAGVAKWLGSEIPNAAHIAGSVLGGPFSLAWRTLSAGVQLVGDVLGPVIHLLSDVSGPLGGVATAALAAWAAFRGVGLVVPLIEGLVTMLRGLPQATVAMIASARASSAAWISSWTSIGSASVAGAATTTASMTAIEEEAAIMAGTIETEGEAAAVGWAGLLGPLAAVGVGIGVLVSLFHHSDTASKAAAEAAKAYSDALKGGGDIRTTAIGAITEQLSKADFGPKLAALNAGLTKLRANSVGVSGSSLGPIAGKDFVAAIYKGGPALDALRTKLKGVIAETTVYGRGSMLTAEQVDHLRGVHEKASTALAFLNTQATAYSKAISEDLANTKLFAGASSSIDQVAQTTKVGSDTARQYAQMLGLVADKNGVIAASSATVTAAVKTVSDAYDNATQSGDSFLTAFAQFSSKAVAGAVTAADRAAIIGATLKAANGDALGFASALNAGAAASKQLSTDVASAAKSVGKSGVSVKTFIKSIVDLKHGTIDYSNAAAAPLINDLQGMQTAAMNAASAVYQHERALKGGKVAADDAYTTFQHLTSGALVAQARQLGLTKGEAQKLADQYFGMPKDVKTLIEQEGANPVLDVLNHIGQVLEYMSGRTWNFDVNIRTHGSVPDAVDRLGKTGEHSGPGRAAGGMAPEGLFWTGEGGPGSRPELVEKHGSNVRVYSHPQSVAISRDLGMKVPGFASGTTKYTAGGSSLISSLNSITSIVKSTPSSSTIGLNNDLSRILAVLAKAGVPSSFLNRLKHDNTAILAATRGRYLAAQHLAAANQALADAKTAFVNDRNSYRDATLGGFDISSAGTAAGGSVTGGSILAEQAQAVTRARAFVAGIKRLAPLLPGPYLRALAGKGPDALPEVQALLSLGVAGLRKVAANEATIAGLANSGALAVTTRLDTPAITAAQAQVALYTREQAADTKALRREVQDLKDSLVHELRTLHLEGKLGLTNGQLALLVESGQRTNKTRHGHK